MAKRSNNDNIEALPSIPLYGKSDVWLRITAFLSNKSPNTKVTYTQVIKEWCQFLGAQAGSEQAARLILATNDVHASAYRSWLQSRPGERPRMERNESSSRAVSLEDRRTKTRKNDGTESTQANATIAKKLSALRRIYRMLIASDLPIKINPFDADRVPPPSSKSGRKRPTEMLPFDDVIRIIESPGNSSARARRDQALLSALFGGGLRRSEVINLRMADLRKTTGGTTFLYLRSTKSKKDAEQAIPSWAAKTIESWHKERVSQGAAGGDYLFISFTGRAGAVRTTEPLTPSAIYKLFKGYCHKCEIRGFFSPHSARATAITKLLDSGFSHREVQEFSRHASVQMVETYDKRRISVDQNPAKNLDFSRKVRKSSN